MQHIVSWIVVALFMIGGVFFIRWLDAFFRYRLDPQHKTASSKYVKKVFQPFLNLCHTVFKHGKQIEIF
jgi:hypothetical protein